MRALLTLALLTCPAVAASQEAIPDIVRRASPAVAVLKVYDPSGTLFTQGSGFFLADGRLVTNTHVVAGGARIEVLTADGRLLGVVDHASNLSASIDIAILPALATAPASLTLATAPPEVGQRAVVIGAPQGLQNTVSDGLISAYRTLEGRRLMQISAPISAGSSGGPVLNLAGEVVGVAVAVYRQGQNLNFAVPLEELRALALSPPGRHAFPRMAVADTSMAPTPVEAASDTVAWSTMQVGRSISGTFVVTDNRLGRYQLPYDYLVLEGRAGQRVRITVRPRGVRTILTVGRMDPDSVVWTGVDTSQVPTLIATIPPTGALEMRVIGEAPSGSYTVSADPIASDPEETDGWEFATVTESDNVRMYINPSRVRRVGGSFVQSWVKQIGAGRTERGRAYDRAMVLYQFDCNAERWATVQIGYYRGSASMDTWESGYLNYQYATPGTIAERLLERSCEVAGL